MNIFKGSRDPYMLFPKRLPGRDRDVLAAATYQIVSGDHGAPTARLDLRFRRDIPAMSNPDMALALLLDRSGSMASTYADGHVFNAANAILDEVAASGGFDIGFYDSRPSFGGHVSDAAALRRIVDANRPQGGGTMVAEALRQTIRRYQGQKKGVYVIVVTDGEFADKAQVERLVLDELLPRLTPENPYALRLHFVGSGEEVDHEFLKRLEAEASGRGVSLVRQHHHAHLRHSHASMIDELDTLYVGVGRDARLDDAAGALVRAGDPTAGLWQDGPIYTIPFLPRHAVIGIEYASPHPPEFDARLRYTGADAPRELSFSIPLPKDGQTGAGVAQAQGQAGGRRSGLFHLPWGHEPQEEQAARQEMARRADDVRQAELARQAADLQELGRGGIPVGARQRLGELSAREGTFTSDLDPDELGLLRGRGYRAAGLVTGSAMYHVGQAYASAYGDTEVRVLSDAYNEATRLAVSRMEQEARLLGAHGAVGVRYDIVRHEWATGTVEVQIMGTAVVGPGPAPKEPWLSDLSGQEWWALERAGYEPAGLVYGHCTWFVLTTWNDEQIKKYSFSNQEFRHQSDGLARARYVALGLLTQQARALGAHGVTGVHISRRLDEVHLTRGYGQPESPVYEYEHHNIILSVIGTGIRLRRDAPRRVVSTRQILSLRDGRMIPAAVHAGDATFE